MSVTVNGTSGITFSNSSAQAYASGLASNTQTWQNVTASRAIGTTYTNSTGYPIMVSFIGYNTGSAVGFTMTISGSATVTFGASSGGVNGAASIIIPVGATYALTGPNVITGWYELR